MGDFSLGRASSNSGAAKKDLKHLNPEPLNPKPEVPNTIPSDTLEPAVPSLKPEPQDQKPTPEVLLTTQTPFKGSQKT